MGELGDLLEAIHNGGRELATVRAAISQRFNGRAMRQAMLDSARREGMPPAQLRRLGEICQSASSEHAVRLWLQPPDRFREELDRGLVTVRDGGHWWRFGPGVGTVTNTDSERDASESRSASGMSAPDPQYGYLFRPARFLGLLEFVPRGHGIVAGRSAWLVDATPSPSLSPLVRHDLDRLGSDADAFELAVDERTGIFLRVTARREGDVLCVTEVVDVAFDESLPPDKFTFVPPAGEPVRLPDELAADHPRRVSSLAELAADAPFRIFAPREVPVRWRLEIHYKPDTGDPERGPFANLCYSLLSGGAQLTVLEQPADRVTARPGFEMWDEPAYWTAEEHDGLKLQVRRPPVREASAVVRLERDKTNINLVSSELEPEELIRIARELEPVSTAPPRFGNY